jgi:hypothetical protein
MRRERRMGSWRGLGWFMIARILDRDVMIFDVGSELGFLLSQHANDASSDFVTNDCLVVLTDDVDAEFLIEEMSIRRVR